MRLAILLTRITDAGAVEYDAERRWEEGRRGVVVLSSETQQGIHMPTQTLDRIRHTVSRASYVSVIGGTTCLRRRVAAVLRRDGIEATAGTTGLACALGTCVSCSTSPKDTG